MLRTLVRDKANLVAESGDLVGRMQKRLDQMNVRVHPTVSDLDGATGMGILRAHRGRRTGCAETGEAARPTLQQNRAGNCRTIEPTLAGGSLVQREQALKMYDAVQERIAAYEQEIVRQLGEMERDEQTGPNGAASVEHQQGQR